VGARPPGETWLDKLGSDPPPHAHESIRAVREMASFLEYLHDPLIGNIHGDIQKSQHAAHERWKLQGDGGALSFALFAFYYFGFNDAILLQFCDFGGAVQVLTTTASVSSFGSAAKVATRRFRAPELWLGEAKSTSTDIFAFGVLLWEFYACAVPFGDADDDIIGNLILRGKRPPVPDATDATRQGFPDHYFALMEECWLEDPKKRSTAEQVHRHLLMLDPTPHAVQGPLVFWHPARTRAPSLLLQCILAAMQAQPGQLNAHLAPMLQAMVAEAAQIISRSPDIQHSAADAAAPSH
jgi:serine/threonine protein kinase